MWIFCCGAKRSGSTLQYNLVSEIVERSGMGRRIPFTDISSFEQILEEYSNFSGYKVFKTHKISDEIKLEFANKNALGIHCYRDIRDVIVSLGNKSGSSYDTFINKSSFMTLFIKTHNDWLSVHPVYSSKYENFAFATEREIKNIAAFLDITSLSEQTIKAIAQKCRIKNLKQKAEDSTNIQRSGNNRFDVETQLHTNHIHSGDIEQWRSSLTKKQISKIERFSGEWLQNFGYQLETTQYNIKERLFALFSRSID